MALNASGKSSYCQIAIVNGNVAGAYSLRRGSGQYMLSSNGGNTFTQTAALYQPASSGGVNYGAPRIEMPSRVTGAINVLQQYSDGAVQKLLVYSVPAPAQATGL